MRVCVHGNRDPHTDRTAHVHIGQVEPARVGVDLQGHTVFGGGLQYGVHIQVGPFAVGDQTSGGVPDDVHVRVADGVQQPGGHALAGLTQAGVQRSDHHIQFGEHFVGEVQRAVGADLHLDALQQPDSIAQRALYRTDFLTLAAQIVHAQPAGHPQAL